MKIKDLIKRLEVLDKEKKVVIVDGNDYEYVLMDINEEGEFWIESN